MPAAVGRSPAPSRTIAAVAVHRPAGAPPRPAGAAHRLPPADPLAAAARQITPQVRAGTITSMFRSVHRCQTCETAKAPAVTTTVSASRIRAAGATSPGNALLSGRSLPLSPLSPLPLSPLSPLLLMLRRRR